MQYGCLFLSSAKQIFLGMCICDDESRFLLAKSEWLSLLLDVNLAEALTLLPSLQWVHDLQLANVDFELDSKVVVDRVSMVQLMTSLILLQLLMIVNAYFLLI